MYTEPAAAAGAPDQAKAGLSQAAKVESIDYGHGQSAPIGKEIQGNDFLQEVAATVTEGAPTERETGGRKGGPEAQLTEGDKLHRQRQGENQVCNGEGVCVLH